MIDRFVVVPASYVLFLREDGGRRQVLLQLRQGTGYMDDHWAAAAAGHIERGESVFEAAAREASEELGVGDLELTPLCAMHRTGRTGDPVDERVDYFLLATSWSGEPRIIEADKCADLRWFDLHDLPTPVVPHELQVIEGLRDGTLAPIVTHGF
ncbi:MAG TPA: NUDIX domain-containing protein [Nocardioidaceae bacterium]|jgi:8-oxo-dGTP pyrophosphatase MutT (NUDIX family)|nr:NUDIX domain-containing protein [Nocardioidaceae bacterium]